MTLLFKSGRSSIPPCIAAQKIAQDTEQFVGVFFKLRVKSNSVTTKNQLKNEVLIIGGGQLARMLALAAYPLGAQVEILSEKHNDPAAQVCSLWTEWSEENLESLARSAQVITFESEFFRLQDFAKKFPDLRSKFLPSIDCMSILQMRNTQKQWLRKCAVPTLDFSEVLGLEQLKLAKMNYPKGFVLKKNFGGYDGKGTFYCRSDKDYENLYTEIELSEGHTGAGFIAEPICHFKRELAVIFARDQHGKIVHYPLVQTKQSQSKCDWVKGPITHSRFAALCKKIEGLLKKINYVGCIGFELFDTGKDLFVNEIAPRVHNSGHCTQGAFVVDQFQLHMQCVLGFRIQEPVALSKGFAMANLLGQTDKTPSFPSKIKSQLHWYGKFLNQPGRKMGHINHQSSTAEQALMVVRQERKKFQL